MTKLTHEEDNLYRRVADILEAARSQVARTVNTAMVHAYWHVGREIVEVEQRGEDRASYGEQLIANLAARLNPRFGRGMGIATLRRIRRFYLTYPNGTTIPRDLASFEIRSTALTELMSGDRVLFPTSLRGCSSGVASICEAREDDGSVHRTLSKSDRRFTMRSSLMNTL
jgi:hypothetical protein